jgi:hypothetical protein
MLKIKIWNRFVHAIEGEEISMEVKRLRYEEAQPLLLALSKANDALVGVTKDSTKLDQDRAMRGFMEALPPGIAADAFGRFVRNVSGLETEDDGAVTTVTTGESLYAVADNRTVMAVLMELLRLARLGSKEGKGSASPRTSSSEGAAADSSSPATSTASEAGATPLDASPTRETDEPSSIEPV